MSHQPNNIFTGTQAVALIEGRRPEQSARDDADMEFHEREYQRLGGEL